MSVLQLEALDHFVLTVASLEVTVDFYTRVLGMEAITLNNGRVTLAFARSRINLHEAGHEFDPKAQRPTPGSADLCFISPVPVERWVQHLADCGVSLELGPVPRQGAAGTLLSVYLRDPDGNLVEIAEKVAA